MHILVFAFLLLYRSLVCWPHDPETAPPTTAGIIFKSADGGQTWQDVSAGLPADFQVGCALVGDNEVFLGSASGLFRSTIPPTARTWEKEFLPNERITNLFPGRSGPYVCCYGSGFFQIVPGRGIWKSMHDALPDKTVRTVLETPNGTVYVGCDSGIYRSNDSGKTWKQVFSKGMVTSLVAAGNVLVGGGSGGALRSTDGGEHWNWVLTEDGPMRKTGRIDGRFVAISNNNGQADAAGSGAVLNRLRMSADNGKTWQRMNVPLGFTFDNAELSPVRAIYDLQQAGKYLFCSCNAGIFRSSDQGKNWEMVRPATRGNLFELAVSGQVVYAIRAFDGC